MTSKVATYQLIALLWLLVTNTLAQQIPSFTATIQPIIIRNCATPCHHPGGVGPFSLLTYHGRSQTR